MRYVWGSHGAALKEPLWSHIADFVIHGSQPPPGAEEQNRFVRSLGRVPEVVWVVLLILVIGGCRLLWTQVPDPRWSTGLTIAWCLLVWRILTRL
jgi:hypothetical protein